MIRFNSNLLNRSLYWAIFWLAFWWFAFFSGNLSQVLVGILLTTPLRLSLPLFVQSKPESTILPVWMSAIFSALFFGLIWGQTWQGSIQSCNAKICSQDYRDFWVLFAYFYAALCGFVGELFYRIIFAPKTSDP